MGLLDFLTVHWSAGDMTHSDRLRMFYYLKRGTSYTTWKRVADSFYAFAKVYEMQVREEPIRVNRRGIGKTKWQAHYAEILRTQVAFETGIKNLLQGDKYVFRYDSNRGYLTDATIKMEYWYSVLVHNGLYGDIILEGKYVEELTELVQKYEDTLYDIDGVQSSWGDRPAEWYWTESWRAQLHNEKVPQPEPHPPKYEGSYLNYPDPLPELPVPQKDVLIYTGAEIPVTGIYEPQMRDGMMNYLLQGTPALRAGGFSKATSRKVTWRLIWEDDRYIDGKIPEEEATYFVPRPNQDLDSYPDVAPNVPHITAYPGEPCPKTGRWIAPHLNNRVVTLVERDAMPGVGEKETTGIIGWHYLGT